MARAQPRGLPGAAARLVGWLGVARVGLLLWLGVLSALSCCLPAAVVCHLLALISLCFFHCPAGEERLYWACSLARLLL